jgi:hypothetical protein
MTDLWRQFFLPAPVMEPTAEELIAVRNPGDMKDKIEHILSSPVHIREFPMAMQYLRRLLPMRDIFAIAGSGMMVKSFSDAIRRPVRQLSSPNQLQGLRRQHIVMLGDHADMRGMRTDELYGILQAGEHTVWNIREWSSL